MTTKREFQERQHIFNALQSIGFTYDECDKMRRISMTLHSWFERECGTDNGCIERDEDTGKAYWLNSNTMKRYPIRDMEAGAMKRLEAIISTTNKRKVTEGIHGQALGYYIQSDPRGAALYILRPGDVPEGQKADGFYNRGICVY